MLRAIASLMLMSGLATAAQMPHQDSRNTDLPNGKTRFRMVVFIDGEARLSRAAFLRKQILAGARLVPMAKKTCCEENLFDGAALIPGLCSAGDFRAAAALDIRGRTLLHNVAAEFPAGWARESAKTDVTSADVRSSPVSDSELLAWQLPWAKPRSEAERFVSRFS